MKIPGFTALFAYNSKSETLSSTITFNFENLVVKGVPQVQIGSTPGSGAAEHAACISDCMSSGDEEGNSLATCSYKCAGVGALDPGDIYEPPTPRCTPGCGICHYSWNNLIGKQRCWDRDCNSKVFDCGPLRNVRSNQATFFSM